MKPEELILADPLREGFDTRQGFGVWAADAKAMLAASPRLTAVMELGLAWEAAEKALPEGGEIEYVGQVLDEWKATAVFFDGKRLVAGPTPNAVEALRALAERLATREGEK